MKVKKRNRYFTKLKSIDLDVPFHVFTESQQFNLEKDITDSFRKNMVGIQNGLNLRKFKFYFDNEKL